MAQRHQALKRYVVCLLVLIDLFSVSSLSLAAPDKIRQEIQQIAVELQQSHGLNLVWENIDRIKVKGLEFEGVSSRDLPRFLAFLLIFREEISKYPSDFFKPSGLSKVIFVKKLFIESIPAHGIYSLTRGYMFFDIYRDYSNQLIERHGIHHEIYHMIATSIWIDPQILPQGWEGLNGPDFKYEKEGRWHDDQNKVNFFAPPQLGFATDYAMSSAEEDQAEIFACLMVKSQRRLIEEWGEKDPILSRKIAAMKKILQVYSPSMDASFWGAPKE